MIVEGVAGVRSPGPRTIPAGAAHPLHCALNTHGHFWSSRHLSAYYGAWVCVWPCSAAPDPGGILIARAFMRVREGAPGSGAESRPRSSGAAARLPPDRVVMVPATDQRFTTFTIAHLHGRSLVAVAGDIDLATAPDLHTHLCAAIDAMISNVGGVVIVDLSAVTFMDASGLTALIRAEARACERGARLRLRAQAPCVTRLLQLTGLGRHFQVCPTSTGDRFPGGRRPKAAKRVTPVLTH